jgi:hypothetical protein
LKVSGKAKVKLVGERIAMVYADNCNEVKFAEEMSYNA